MPDESLLIEMSGTAEISTGTTRSNCTPADSEKTRPWLSVWIEWLGTVHPSR
jgi:hypothetical protein